MANKSLFSRIFSKDNGADSEVKALQDRLDAVVGEHFDAQTYETKFIEAEASMFGPSGMANFSGIDQIVDVAALQRVYASETWVYSAVNAISDTVSSLPLRLEKRREYKRSVFNDLADAVEIVKHEAWEPAAGEKLNKLFQRPNAYSTRGEFMSLLTVDLLTAGDYYIYLKSDQDLDALSTVNQTDQQAGVDSPWSRLRTAMSENTHIEAMYRIPPSMIKPVMDTKSGELAGYVLQTDKGNYAFSPAEIIHVRLPNPNDQSVGLSPLIPAFKSILLDRFTTEHMIRFYKSGARLGGIIETDKALNKEQLARFQRSFESNFTGRHNHHRTLILPPGMTYRLVEQNPAETALLEFCRYNREAILAVYRVPPIKLGVLENANYANARIQLKMFFTQTVKKYLDIIQDGFNNHPAMLLDNRTYRVQFDLSNVEELQEDLREKAQAASEMLKSGATVNEVREAIWKKGPLKGGEDSPVVVDMQAVAKGAQDPFAALMGGKQLEAKQESQISLSGSQVQSMLNIVEQVAAGKLPRSAGAEIVNASFGVPRDAAERMMGSVGTTFTMAKPPSAEVSGADDGSAQAKEALPDVQADTALLSDISPTEASFSERVAQLVEAFVAGGVQLSVAIPKAIEQARLEGFTDPDATTEDKDLGTQPGNAGAEFVPTNIGDNCPKCDKPLSDCTCGGDKSVLDKPTLAEYLASEIAKLSDDSTVDPTSIEAIKQRYKEIHEGAAEVKEVQYANGYTKDSITAYWKTFISKTDPLVVNRHSEVSSFFDKYKSLVMNRLGANLKAFGLFKARDNDDVNEILDPAAYEKLIDSYIAQIDKSLNAAMEAGYADTLAEFKFGEPTEEAKAALRKYALMSAKSIDNTTREQLKTLLADMFEQGKSIQEISVSINDKFKDIDTGRAVTIARTETLTAVSLGKAAKRTEWQQRFPDAKLMKMWVTAKDDRVRDTHEDLEGVSVESNESFPNGLAYPRDPSGEASEVINCRCDVIDYAQEDRELIEDRLNQADEESKE